MAIPDIESDGTPGGGSQKYFRMSSLKKGPVKGTLVTDFISGWEGWPEGSKSPLRAHRLADFPADVVWRKETTGFKEGPKQFWAALWRNWTEDGILQIFMPVQVSVIKALKGLEVNPDWGELPGAGYAVTVSRVVTKDKNGEDKITYTVVPSPVVKTTKAQDAELTALLESWTGLAALYSNGDPWATFDELVPSSDDKDLGF